MTASFSKAHPDMQAVTRKDNKRPHDAALGASESKRQRLTETQRQCDTPFEEASQTSEGDLLLPAKAQLTREDIHAVKTTQQRPKSKSSTRRRASFTGPYIGGRGVSPATRLRKRQVGSGSEGDDNEHQQKRPRLTRENLAPFDEMGRRKASDPSADDSSIKTTSTTTSGFAIQAYKNGMLNPTSSKPPANIEDIRERHARSRTTASPPESRFKHYAHAVARAPNEATMVVEVSGHMLKDHDDESYQRTFNQAFTGYPRDVGFNHGLSAPQPDFVEGLELRQFHRVPVDDIDGAVLYKDDPDSLVLPHIAGEWKGRGKDMEEASLQSRYDGAALVRARNQALSYLGRSDPLGHAEVTTFTTDGTNINFFAHYAAKDEEGELEYHQYLYASENVKDTYQGHKNGRRGLRNQQDKAREQSYDLRDQLKAYWKQQRDLERVVEGTIPCNASKEATADEGEADFEIVEPITPDTSLTTQDGCAPSVANNKRKASSPPHRQHGRRSKAKDYWELDENSGEYFHRHSDGRTTWFENCDNGN